jgi:hypothetical protein
MPNRKVTLTAFSKMDARVEALEEGMEEVRSTLKDVQSNLRESYANIVALLEKHLGKTVVSDGGVESIVTGETPENSNSSKKRAFRKPVVEGTMR